MGRARIVTVVVLAAACASPGPVDRPAAPQPAASAAPAVAASTSEVGPAPPTASAEVDAGAGTEPDPPTSDARASDPAELVMRCAPLPPRRPPGVVIRFLRVVVPHGGDARKEGLELHAEMDCPATSGPRTTLEVLPCRRLSAADLDAVYAKFRRAPFSALKSDGPPAGSPHYGTRVLEIVWDDHACRVVDSPQTPVRRASQKTFFELVDAVVAAGAPP